MRATPRFSCLIVNYQCGDYLVRCLRTLFDRLKGAFEVIVVDNASTDRSVANAKALNLPVTWICLPDNVGFGRGNNIAAGYATGDFLILLNPDTELRDDCITPLLDYLDGHPDIGLIGGRHDDRNGCWQRSFGLTPTLKLELEYALAPKRFWSRLPESSPQTPIEVDWVCGSFMILRRALSESIGLFDERFFLNDEDINLCDRVRSADLKVIYLPIQGVVHFGGVSKSLYPSSSMEYYRSRKLYYRINRGRLAEAAYVSTFWLRRLRDMVSIQRARFS